MFAGNEPLNNSPLTQDQATDQDADQARLEGIRFLPSSVDLHIQKEKTSCAIMPLDRVVALSLELE